MTQCHYSVRAGVMIQRVYYTLCMIYYVINVQTAQSQAVCTCTKRRQCLNYFRNFKFNGVLPKKAELAGSILRCY